MPNTLLTLDAPVGARGQYRLETDVQLPKLVSFQAGKPERTFGSVERPDCIAEHKLCEFASAIVMMTWLSSRLPFLFVGALVCLISPSILGDELGAAAPEEVSGGVKLKWTAPGDDGYDGLAMGYDVRYQPMSFGAIDTENEWQAAARVYSLPAPSPAGGRDSVTIFGLVPGMGYYFALKTFDEVYNYSELSNSPLIVATPMECCQGKVGDANGRDGETPTLSDVMVLVDHVFITGRSLSCAAEADINQSGGVNPQQGPGGDITLSDIMALVDHIFLTGQPLPDCIQ